MKKISIYSFKARVYSGIEVKETIKISFGTENDFSLTRNDIKFNSKELTNEWQQKSLLNYTSFSLLSHSRLKNEACSVYSKKKKLTHHQ